MSSETTIKEFINHLAVSGQLAEPRKRASVTENPVVKKGFICQNEQVDSNYHNVLTNGNCQKELTISNYHHESIIGNCHHESIIGNCLQAATTNTIDFNDFPLPIMVKNPLPRFASRIDWLQGTFKYDQYLCLKILVKELEQIFGDTFEWGCGPCKRGVKYDDSARSLSGIILAWIRPAPEKAGSAWISIPGKAMDRLLRDDDGQARYTALFRLLTTGGSDNRQARYTSVYRLLTIGCLDSDEQAIALYRLLTTARSTDYENYTLLYGWKPTRIDTTVDDFHKKNRPIELLEAAEKGNYSGFRYAAEGSHVENASMTTSYLFTTSPKCDVNGIVHKSATLYFGSTQSDKRIYIYDKFLQSEGKIDSVRWEARWMDDHATKVFERICECLFQNTGQLGFVIAEITLGAIDFVERKPGIRASRCKRLDFWQEMIDQLGRVKLAVGSTKVYIEKSVDWIFNQVATSLAVIRETCGEKETDDAIKRLMGVGMSRLKSSHQSTIEQGKKDEFNLHKYLDQILCENSGFT